MMDHWGVMAVWMLLWGLLGLALIALAVVAVVWAVRGSDLRPGRWPAHFGSDRALEELRRRYAAGEIEEEEYQRRLRVLGYPGVGTPGGAASSPGAT